MDTVQEIISVAEARASALAAGDAKRLEKLLHERFTWTSHTGATFGREEYISRNTGGRTVWRSQRLSTPR